MLKKSLKILIFDIADRNNIIERAIKIATICKSIM